jgi:hypothetical protein
MDRVIELCKNFQAVSANSERYPEVVLAQANSYPVSIAKLLEYILETEGKGTAPEVLDITTFVKNAEVSELLASLFRRFGSDKSTHGYHQLYSQLFRRDAPINVLEIGLGTNNEALLSSMGARGQPGASLRAFREYFPNALIFGADIDTDILFTEERIRTAYVDQLRPETLTAATGALGEASFDLIIDDGLHSLTANVNTLLFGLKHVNVGGYVIIEDIATHYDTETFIGIIWKSNADTVNMSGKFEAKIIKATYARMLMVHRKM